jgi:hypothetical protein
MRQMLNACRSTLLFLTRRYSMHRLLTDEQLHVQVPLTIVRHGEKLVLSIEPEESPVLATA